MPIPSSEPHPTVGGGWLGAIGKELLGLTSAGISAPARPPFLPDPCNVIAEGR